MFCACLSIIFCVVILIGGTTVSMMDITRYDFGLYYALIAIVGLTAAITVCVIRPKHGCCTRDPRWYTNCCERLNRCLIEEQQRVALAKSGLRDGNTFSNAGDTDKRDGVSNPARQQRATLVMLRPAVELMQHMLHGLVSVDEDGEKDDEETTSDPDEATDDPSNRRRKNKKKKKKKLTLPANEACLYTILETSMADTVTMVPPTEVTSVTVHETYPQLLNDPVPHSPTGLLSPTTLATQRQQFLLAQRKHLFNQAASDSPRLRGLPEGQSVFTFHRHDIISEPLDEERFSETRCSSTHEG